MNNDATVYVFASRNDFSKWLSKNFKQENGIWIQFTKGDKGFSPNAALEEAICFGWIDGLIKSMDNTHYKKYFSKRKDLKKWSSKNIAIYNKLLEKGLIKESGINAFKPVMEGTKGKPNFEEMIFKLREALKQDTTILGLFDNAALSRRKQMAGFYCDAKTEETRRKRALKIEEALKVNYNGMLY